MLKDNSIYGVVYESFINNAYGKLGYNPGIGADDSLFKGLAYAEKGESKAATPYEKQLSTVKTFMKKAIDKYLKMKLNETERSIVNYQLQLLQNASSTDELIQIMQAVFDATKRITEAPR